MPSEAYRRQSIVILSADDCLMKSPLAHWCGVAASTVDHQVLWSSLYDVIQEFDPGQGVRTVGDAPTAKPCTPEDYARIWNRAVARLGFVEGNPES